MKKTTKIIIGVVIALLGVGVVTRLSCRKAPEPELPPAPGANAAAYTARLAAERMEDPVYRAGLKDLETRQTDLAKKRDALVAEFAAWRNGFLASNEAARAFLEKARADGVPADPNQLEKLIAADPQGAAFVARREAVDAEMQDLRKEIRAFIGARLRQQAQAHAPEEKAASEKYLAEHPAPRLISTNGQPRAEALDPYWTNALAARAEAAAAARQTNAPSVPAATPDSAPAKPVPTRGESSRETQK